MGEWDFQVLANEKKNVDSSEIAARDEFNRKHPHLTGLSVPGDLRTMELVHRPWRNNKGLFFNLGNNNIIQAHLSELAPGGNSTRHRHTTEAYLYIVKGHGYSIINYDDEPEERVDWSEGTLFSPPVWSWHQHFNLDPNETARYLAVQDTGLLRHLRLHNIERHPTQLKTGEGTDYTIEAVAAPSGDGGKEESVERSASERVTTSR
jgi:quercetin dioxygenase-like cupin family protein